VRLKDVANVALGNDDYESTVALMARARLYRYPGGTRRQSARRHQRRAHGVSLRQSQLPQGLNGTIVYDSTDFVSSSISEVIRSLVEAVLIVTVVVFVFLGSPRSVLIPVIAIPLSLIAPSR